MRGTCILWGWTEILNCLHRCVDSNTEGLQRLAEFAGAAHDLDPKSLKAALRRSDAEKWQEAVEFEFDNHIRNGTWEMLS